MSADIPFLDLAAETRALREDLDAAWARVRDGNALILGPELAAFEAEFAAFCGSTHALGVGNGLDALVLALRALDIGPGDEVIVPAHTFVATWLAVMAVGARPVPCEPDAGHFTISAAGAAPLVTPQTRAILPVHLYGQPADPQGLAALCAEAGLALVEDAAQAHGATSQGRIIGSFGQIGCFSFYPTKNLGALGDGGAVTTSDPALAARLALLRNYGAREKYFTELIGTNSRLDELQAALLRVKLARQAEFVAMRRAKAARYAGLLEGVAGLELPRTRPGDQPVWHIFVIRTKARDALRDHLARAGIGTGLHYPVPVYRNAPFSDFAPQGETETDRISAEVLSLPLWPLMPNSAVDRVAHEIRRFFGA